MQKITIVLGVLQDVHTLGARVLQYALEQEEGFSVVNLGCLLTQEDFINAAKETDARVILVSSSYGHAIIDCEGFRDKCIEVGLGNILLYIGGNLVVSGQLQTWEEVVKAFKRMRFDRVYPPYTSAEQAIADLKADLASKK